MLLRAWVGWWAAWWVLGVCAGQCSISTFACEDGQECIPLPWRCDGKPDCKDESDESPKICPEPTCATGDFQCASGPLKCIPPQWKCDGEDDCPDASDEDLELCSHRSCQDEGVELWQCSSGQCIHQVFRCDGETNCRDGSDELDCPNATCTPDQFTCASGMCINKFWRCDGANDCGEDDMSDEMDCPTDKCAANQMECSDGTCISRQLVCDGRRDCSSGEDEHDCPSATCGPDDYACAGGFSCIRKEWLCDGDLDCKDGDDEVNCPTPCAKDQFQCPDQSCVPLHNKCNGFPDCVDGADEKDCEPQCDEELEFNCGEGVCIPMARVCDGHDDCGNGRDEPEDGRCGVDECKVDNGGCAHECADTRMGRVCRCKQGYLLVNQTQCEDINECVEPGVCSQVCVNTRGGYKCECVAGYVRDPHHHNKCKAMEGHASLLFARSSDIRKISLDHQEMTAIVNQTKKATALDFVFKTGMIFWADAVDRHIYKAPIDEGNKKVVVVEDDVTMVDGLAVDWLYNHIYWSNTESDTIVVADFNGDMRKTLYEDHLEEPRALALYPSEGWMFWTDWGREAKIERGGMDGQHRKAIVTQDIIWPNALTLDLVLRKVYWLDSKLHSIYSCDFDGTNRRVVLHSVEKVQHPFSLTVFEDTLYWTDWGLYAILKANKFTGKDVATIATTYESPMTVHVYHSFRQPNGTNHCTPLNGLCTHLCLPAPQLPQTAHTHKISCACPDGLVLMSDGLTCGNKEPESTMAPAADQTPQLDVPVEDGGSVAVAAVLAGIVVLCVASAMAYVIYRYFRKRSVHSMNFDNPVYKKTTTEDGFHLAGQQRGGGGQRNSQPRFHNQQYGVASPEDSLEPLTHANGNFV